MAEKIVYNLRSVFAMGHIYARMNRSGGSYAERFAAGLRQAWAEEKDLAARKAARAARFNADNRANLALADSARLCREAMPERTSTYSFQRGIRTGAFQGGSW